LNTSLKMGSFVRLGVSVSARMRVTASGAVSSLDCGLFGSSLSAGSSVRQGSSLSVSLWTLAGGSVSFLDFANLASAIMRTYSRLRSNVSILM
jgi:hypothetical protein